MIASSFDYDGYRIVLVGAMEGNAKGDTKLRDG